MSASHFNKPSTHIFKLPAAELCQLGVTLFLVTLDLWTLTIFCMVFQVGPHILKQRLRSKHLFLPAVQNGLGIHVSQWTNLRWNTEYCENIPRLPAFIPMTSIKPVGMSFPQTAWVKLNCLRTDGGQFHSSMHK